MTKPNNKNSTDTQNLVASTAASAVVAATDYDYSEYANQGFENQTRDDYAVPFLGVLQTNSPLCETSATARPGMLVNTVTQETYTADGVVFIPVDTQHVVVEWKPRSLGGGFVAVHEMSSEIVKKAAEEQEFGKWKTIKGDLNSNDLVETFYVYGLMVHESGASEQMIIAFTSTKIKSYKRWMTKARTLQVALPDGRRVNPPLFAHKYRVTTVKETNPKGSFFNFNVEFAAEDAVKCRLGTTNPLFLSAKAFFDLLKEGKIKAAHDSQTTVGEAGAEDTDTPFK
jgi:hypothetical protein